VARIATLQEFMPLAGIHDAAKADEDVLQLFLDGAERFGERWTGRSFSPDPPLDANGDDTGADVTKTFSARNKTRLIRVPDLREVTSATLDGTLLTRDSTFYVDSYVEPALFFELVTRFTGSGRGELAVTGRWGPLEVDADVKAAVLVLAARGYKRRDASFSDVLNTAQGAQMFWSMNMPEEVRAVFVSLRLPNLIFV
jgi:hypothetical protein